MKITVIFITVLVALLAGCSQEVSYKSSAIHSDFPIPKNAKLTEGKAKNPNIEKCVRYKWKDADEIGSITANYLKEIKNNGWKEREKELLGARRVFEKNGTVIWLTTHNGFFTLAKLKKDTE
jgi:hypothetical protein